jgi:hypothetical protein
MGQICAIGRQIYGVGGQIHPKGRQIYGIGRQIRPKGRHKYRIRRQKYTVLPKNKGRSNLP